MGETQTNQLLTGKELAKILKVAEVTIRAWVAQDKIPYHKIGGAVRFNLAEVLKSSQRERK